MFRETLMPISVFLRLFFRVRSQHETDRQRHTDGQTGRQTDRQMDWQDRNAAYYNGCKYTEKSNPITLIHVKQTRN